MRRPAPCAGDIRLTRFEFHIFPSEKSNFSRAWLSFSARLRSPRVDQQLQRARQVHSRKAVIFGSAIGPLPWRTRLLKRSRTSMPSRFSAAKLCGRTGSRGSFDHPFVGCHVCRRVENSRRLLGGVVGQNAFARRIQARNQLFLDIAEPSRWNLFESATRKRILRALANR